MDNKLFRKKSLSKVTSPDNLDSFLRVTNPSTWVGLAAILIVLIGAVGWAVFGTVESTVNGVVVSNEKACVCYVSEEDIVKVKSGMSVRMEDDSVTIAEVSDKALLANVALSDYAMQLGEFQAGEYVFALPLSETLSLGSYKCEVVIESISPIDFLS